MKLSVALRYFALPITPAVHLFFNVTVSLIAVTMLPMGKLAGAFGFVLGFYAHYCIDVYTSVIFV